MARGVGRWTKRFGHPLSDRRLLHFGRIGPSDRKDSMKRCSNRAATECKALAMPTACFAAAFNLIGEAAERWHAKQAQGSAFAERQYASTMRNRKRCTVAADPASATSIQQAVDCLDEGGLVYLPPGTYRIERTIRLHSGVTVAGAGADSTVLELVPGSNCHVFTNDDWNNGNASIELTGFSIEGNMPAQRRPPEAKWITFVCGGYFKRVRNLVVNGITARSVRQTAFHFSECTHVDIRGLVVDQMGWSGVSTSGTDDIVLRDVVVSNAGLDVLHSGIHLDGGRGAYVEAVVDGCTGNGIMLDSNTSPLSDVVVRGVARGSMRGLSLIGGYEHELTNVCLSGDYSNNRECGVLCRTRRTCSSWTPRSRRMAPQESSSKAKGASGAASLADVVSWGVRNWCSSATARKSRHRRIDND